MNKQKDDIVIDIQNLSKVYKLYQQPNHRFLDMLGLLSKKHTVNEHAALNNISLTIRRGEKIGIIGRNGAGKSTLLKLISGIISPTNGTLIVNGTARALLQIGSGFHPEFTGRENVLAYLAQMGVAGKKAENLLYDIIDFAELEEYIDQPLKTYSTGMGARLMFATSTAIAPSLLILDEILSVGDAYFTQKCMDRITELCDRDGTTLLLVSHDIYTTSKLCERMIWIDKGQILADDEALVTLKHYENSVRHQEENRIRKKMLLSLQKQNTAIKNKDVLIVEFEKQNKNPLKDPIYFSNIQLKENEQIVAELPLHAQSALNENSGLFTESTCWGEPCEYQGKLSKPMMHFGSNFHKVSGYFHLPNLLEKLQTNKLSLSICSNSPHKKPLNVNIYYGERLFCSQQIEVGNDVGDDVGNAWDEKTILLKQSNTQLSMNDVNDIIYGNGAIEITDVTITDESNNLQTVIEHGQRLQLNVKYHINDKSLNTKVDMIIAIMKNGLETSCRLYDNTITMNTTQSADGILSITLENCYLGQGDYSITLLIGKHGYNEQANHRYFSISPDIYVFVRDALEFKVTGGGLVAQGTPYVVPAKWSRTINKQTKYEAIQ